MLAKAFLRRFRDFQKEVLRLDLWGDPSYFSINQLLRRAASTQSLYARNGGPEIILAMAYPICGLNSDLRLSGLGDSLLGRAGEDRTFCRMSDGLPL